MRNAVQVGVAELKSEIWICLMLSSLLFARCIDSLFNPVVDWQIWHQLMRTSRNKSNLKLQSPRFVCPRQDIWREMQKKQLAAWDDVMLFKTQMVHGNSL